MISTRFNPLGIKPKPYAYEVEYLESTGTQYIDTGHAFADDFSWEIKCNAFSGGTTIFGGRTQSYRTAILYRLDNGVITVPIGTMTGVFTPVTFDITLQYHTYKVAVRQQTISAWQDGEQKNNSSPFEGAYITGSTQAIFADNYGNSVSEFASGRVCFVKMWQGSLIVRDFIPVVDFDGIPCMYDKVSKQLFYNQGTGEFIAGERI